MIVNVKLSESIYSLSLTETIISTSPKKFSVGSNVKLLLSKDKLPDLNELNSTENSKSSFSTSLANNS